MQYTTAGLGGTQLLTRDVVLESIDQHAVLMDRLPIGYIASCQEIARVILFMASDDAGYFVGQTVYPDGGRSIQGFPRHMER